MQREGTDQANQLPSILWHLLAPLPLPPLDAALAFCVRGVVARHRMIFARLGQHAHKRFGIDPSDLPFGFVLQPDPHRPRMVSHRRLPNGLDAVIRGNFMHLLALLEGDTDGDALFFSRDIWIEGDMESVIALRNAIDDAGIDLVREICTGFGPLDRDAARALRQALALLRTRSRDPVMPIPANATGPSHGMP